MQIVAKLSEKTEVLKRARSSSDGGSSGLQLSGLESLVGYNLKRAFMVVHKQFKATLEEFELTQRTFSVLSVVVENPGVSQSEVARCLAIERSGAVVIVDELEQRQFISREKVPTDRRAYALRVTESGLAFYQRAFKEVQRYEERLMEGISEQEQRALSTFLESIQRQQ